MALEHGLEALILALTERNVGGIPPDAGGVQPNVGIDPDVRQNLDPRAGTSRWWSRDRGRGLEALLAAMARSRGCVVDTPGFDCRDYELPFRGESPLWGSEPYFAAVGKRSREWGPNSLI